MTKEGSRYARFLDDQGRRETWEETVDRYIDFWKEHMRDPHTGLNQDVLAGLHEAREAILFLEVMPSMRCLMTAGAALDRDNVAGYNCAYTPVDHPRVFDEILYILMCGTGVGFSVERDEINKLPEVAEELHETDTAIVVSDSKIGWASAFREIISLLYAGKIPKWDLSRVRAAGSRLKTFGGRSSGPAPLEDLFRFSVEVFRGATGRRLNSLEVHDLVCKIASIVVVGGVRRSALISLSNLTDQRMRHAKDGNFYEQNPQRTISNNSVAYTETPDVEIFLEEWLSLYRSKSGERGFFNRQAADYQVDRSGRRETGYQWGCNPCSEIILRPAQFCNLTEVVVRADDTPSDLDRKVRIATFLGTLQSTLTDFRYLRSIWKKNCEEERLLGVSLTGILDHKVLGDYRNAGLPNQLSELKVSAIEENLKWSETLGIARSSAITCVKPSGTVSQLTNTASGIHVRHAPYYLRRVRADRKDPLAQWMIEQGFPCEDDVVTPSNVVFSFPIAAPEGSRTHIDPLEHLELWKLYQDEWCDHKPSVTVSYEEKDFMQIGAWLLKHFHEVSGISFLPKDGGVYQQAPYEAISKDVYAHLIGEMPEADWSTFTEKYDNTRASQELACSGDVCEVVDL
jgi:ribonucleoside-diphosphate reductase alpha chain